VIAPRKFLSALSPMLLKLREIGGHCVCLTDRAPGRIMTSARANPRRTLIFLTTAVVVFALAAGGFTLLAQRRDQVEAARAEALTVAQRLVTALLFYDYRSLPKDLGDRQDLITGKFKTDYTGLVSSVIAPAAVRTQLLTRSNVSEAGVVDTHGTDQVTVLMFVNQTTRSVASPEPQLLNTRVRVTMLEQNGKWLISELTPG